MSNSCSQNLCDCGCCEGLSDHTPLEVANQPGLAAIAYRVGGHADFKQSMLARLSTSRLLALKELQTREDDDFSIALLDGWATVADVLTFYQERIANESYLRTATERRSLLELARLIGYELRPGVAAGTYLAFTLDDAPGSPGESTIDVGTKVQSVPGPGEKSQTFETIEAVQARAIWNGMRPRLTQPQQLAKNMGRVVLRGTTTKLSKGDTLLIIVPDSASDPDPAVVERVTVDDTKQQTTVELGETASSLKGVTSVYAAGRFAVGALPFNSQTIDDLVLQKSWKASDLNAFA